LRSDTVETVRSIIRHQNCSAAAAQYKLMFLSPSLALRERESKNQAATDVCFIQSCTVVTCCCPLTDVLFLTNGRLPTSATFTNHNDSITTCTTESDSPLHIEQNR